MGVIVSLIGVSKAKWDDIHNMCYITYDDNVRYTYNLSNVHENNIVHNELPYQNEHNDGNCEIVDIEILYLNVSTWLHIIFQHPTLHAIKHYAYHIYEKMYSRYKYLTHIFCVLDVINIIMSNVKIIEFYEYYMNLTPKFVTRGYTWNLLYREHQICNSFDYQIYAKRHNVFTNIFRTHFKNFIINSSMIK